MTILKMSSAKTKRKTNSIHPIMTDYQDSAAAAIAAPTIRGGLNPEAARLFRVYRTIGNMLDKRGYMVPKAIRELTPTE
jgi:hypothetical protein